MAKLLANSGDPDQTPGFVASVWVCTVCQILFYRSPDHNGLMFDYTFDQYFAFYKSTFCVKKEILIQ